MNIDVTGDTLKLSEKEGVNSGAINYYEIKFEFDAEWDGLTKVAVILEPKEQKVKVVPIIEDEIYVPFLKEGAVYTLGVVGFLIDGDVKTKQISTNLLFFNVRDGAGSIMTKGGDVPPADVWEQYLQTINRLLDETIEARDTTEGYRDETVGLKNETAELKNETSAIKQETLELKNETEELKNTTEEYKDETFGYMGTTKGYRDEAEGFKDDSETAEGKTTQAYQDFLNQLGTEVATLTDGKLTPSQIPALALNDVFEVDSVNELLTLTAERGDVGLIMGEDDDENPIVIDSYMLATDDPTVLANWKKLGISYVANAGHAQTAGFAENSNKINGHRLITMTETQYAGAVLEEECLYAVYPD